MESWTTSSKLRSPVCEAEAPPLIFCGSHEVHRRAAFRRGAEDGVLGDAPLSGVILRYTPGTHDGTD